MAHLLSGAVETTGPVAPEATPSRPGRIDHVEAEISSLREELAELRQAFDAFKAQF